MTLVRAAELGIDRFSNDRGMENWSVASSEAREVIIRAVYRQVLGQQHLMASERLKGAESLFRDGGLTVRELVRRVAQSALYRSRFFEHSNAYRFIELNHKHLLGRAPHNREEMLHHFTILQEQGYEAEIDSYIDSPEYQGRFGNDVVPYLHGWNYDIGHEGRQFSWLMQLARGAAASVKGSSSGHQAALNRALHQNRAIPVSGALPPVFPVRGVLPRITDYSLISTDGPFQAVVSEAQALHADGLETVARQSHAHSERESVRLGSSGFRGRGSRTVTISVTGVADQAYVRSGDYVIRVPLSRMNQGLQRAHALGRVTQVVVS